MININKNTMLRDYVIMNRKSKSYVLIDVSVPNNKNIVHKEAEKLKSKCNLEIEIN